MATNKKKEEKEELKKLSKEIKAFKDDSINPRYESIIGQKNNKYSDATVDSLKILQTKAKNYQKRAEVFGINPDEKYSKKLDKEVQSRINRVMQRLNEAIAKRVFQKKQSDNYQKKTNQQYKDFISGRESERKKDREGRW